MWKFVYLFLNNYFRQGQTTCACAWEGGGAVVVVVLVEEARRGWRAIVARSERASRMTVVIAWGSARGPWWPAATTNMGGGWAGVGDQSWSSTRWQGKGDGGRSGRSDDYDRRGKWSPNPSTRWRTASGRASHQGVWRKCKRLEIKNRTTNRYKSIQIDTTCNRW